MVTDTEPMPPQWYDQGLVGLLEAGETQPTAAPVRIASGVGPSAPPSEAAEAASPPESPGKKAAGITLGVLSPNIVIKPLDRLVDRVLYGVAADGSATSDSPRLRGANFRLSGFRDIVVAVTGRRLLLCTTREHGLWSSKDEAAARSEPLQLVWQAPRAQVRGAIVGRHRLNPARLRIDFTDGSWAAFTSPPGETMDGYSGSQPRWNRRRPEPYGGPPKPGRPSSRPLRAQCSVSLVVGGQGARRSERWLRA
jgi:hypothetical protein